MTENPVLSGVLPVLHMPYHDDFTIDYGTLHREIDYLFNAGADGIVLALASELLRLNRFERLELTSKLPMMADGRGTVTISVGAETSHEAAFYAEAAEQAGAKAVMAIPPLTTSVSAAKKLEYYKTIFHAVSIPVVVQDASGYMGGEKLSSELLAQLRNELGPRIYFKPEGVPVGQTISALQSKMNGNVFILEGSGGYMLIDNYRRGVTGTMPGSDLIHGIVGIWKALEAGNDDRAYELYFPLAAIVILQLPSLDAFLAIEKYLLLKQGVFKNRLVRQPSAYDLDAHTAEEVDRLYNRYRAVLGK